MTDIDWTTGTHEALVSLGTHKLFLRASGSPRRHDHNPIVIIEAGLGSFSFDFTLVQEHLAKFVRVYSYDRAGLGNSEPTTLPLTAENRAKELLQLLDIAGVKPPYVTLGHSFGGIITREFLALIGAGPSGIVGMVFVDANQEKSCEYMDLSFMELLPSDVEYEEIIGMRANALMPAEYWTQKAVMEQASEAVTNAELAAWPDDCRALGKKRQLETHPLGSHRVSVVKGSFGEDLRKVLAWADDHEREPVEVREELRAKVEAWPAIDWALQEEQLKLSSQGRMVEAQGIGRTHCVHIMTPELIVQEVKWVLGLPDV